MEPFVLNTEEFFSIEQWENQWPQLVVGFTTKNGGYSIKPFSSLNFGFHVNDTVKAVCQNKQKLAERLSFPVNNWVAAEQTHGTNIKNVNKKDCGSGSFCYDDSIPNTDGLYTNDRGILLTLCFADCVPIYFIDKVTKTIGIAHAGWKGTVNGIAREMITKWVSNGINPKDVVVAIGPSICEKCYIVDDFVIEFVQKILDDEDKKPYNLITEGQYQLDLKQLNRYLLIQAGVPDSNIVTTDYCTSCHSNEFFSHRREFGKTGRMMSFIGWKEDS